MTKILFICHGNICRSPMAEFVFVHLARERGVGDRFSVASCATSTEEIIRGVGNPVYPPARRDLEKRGVTCGGHRSRQITMDDYRHFDRIYYMDASNARWLSRMLPKDPDKIRPLLDRDVADPWYTGDFEQTWQDIVEGCRKIMEEFA